MMSALRTLVTVAREDGPLQATLAGGGHYMPPPYKQRVTFTRKFLASDLDRPTSRRRRFDLWRRGFLPRSARLYDLDEHGHDAYLSALAEERAWRINAPHRDVLDDKVTFHDLLADRGFADVLPRRLGQLDETGHVDGRQLGDAVRDAGSLVVKSRRGAAGSAVYVCTVEDGTVHIDGTAVDWDTVDERARDWAGSLVTEYCNQADYAADLYPRAANTIRLLTMTPPDGQPFVARAVHRLGTDASAPVDNFSRGGLSAAIDDEGTLSPAVAFTDGAVSWHEQHPDTGTPIAGTTVPGWETVRERVRSIAAAVPEVTYVGWDAVVTGTGEVVLLEGNANTDTDLIQAHAPLLTDPRIRQFYRHHDVI